MFSFSFCIDNPLPRRWLAWCNLGDHVWHGKLSRHKVWEIQTIGGGRGGLLGVDFRFRLRGQDHAGPSLEVDFLGQTVIVQIYDCRHWNHKTNDWHRLGSTLDEQCEEEQND